jgi:hypothetical protein
MRIRNLKLFHAAVFAFALSASSCQMLQGVMGMLGPLLGGGAGGLVDEGDGGSAMSLTGGGSGSQSGYKVVSALGQEDEGKLYGMYTAGR